MENWFTKLLIANALKDSWIPWDTLLLAIAPAYAGPYLVEVFNAIPPFVNLMRLTRRKFWIPGEDPSVPGVPSAYEVARDGIAVLCAQLDKYA